MLKETKIELVGRVAIELSNGTEMKNIPNKMKNFFGPCTRQVRNAIALINKAGKQTEC